MNIPSTTHKQNNNPPPAINNTGKQRKTKFLQTSPPPTNQNTHLPSLSAKNPPTDRQNQSPPSTISHQANHHTTHNQHLAVYNSKTVKSLFPFLAKSLPSDLRFPIPLAYFSLSPFIRIQTTPIPKQQTHSLLNRNQHIRSQAFPITKLIRTLFSTHCSHLFPCAIPYIPQTISLTSLSPDSVPTKANNQKPTNLNLDHKSY